MGRCDRAGAKDWHIQGCPRSGPWLKCTTHRNLGSYLPPVRQPDWWQGDDLYHAPKSNEPVSELERRLRAGEFVVACEIAPPLSASTNKLVSNIELVKPY